MKAENKLFVRSIEIKEEAKNVVLIKKRHRRVKTHRSNGFWTISYKIKVSENCQVHYGQFPEKEIEMYCYINKSRWDVQYLDKSGSHWLLAERW